ncbi:hypothetical protein Slala03_35760 [Streptomyces lavendulae subsp. lavendulae]|nr:hypothetical protein Slala03_35760 [Streptomyces lavendulae subsp. lavendulae]
MGSYAQVDSGVPGVLAEAGRAGRVVAACRSCRADLGRGRLLRRSDGVPWGPEGFAPGRHRFRSDPSEGGCGRRFPWMTDVGFRVEGDVRTGAGEYDARTG